MLDVVAFIIGFALVLVMTTLGSVLLVRFMLGSSTPVQRVFAAASIGPASVVLPLLTYAIIDGDTGWLDFVLALAFVVMIAIAVVGWPVAHFATKRLDRLTRNDAKVFE